MSCRPGPTAQLGDPLLRCVAAGDGCVSPACSAALEEVLVATGAAGLAAPQIGCTGRTIALAAKAIGTDAWARMTAGECGRATVVHLDPRITETGHDVDLDFEGCLSVPRIAGLVPRATALTYSARILGGDVRVSGRLVGSDARVVQHEVDHLDGVLFVDRANTRSLMTTGSVERRYGRDVARARAALGV